MVDSGEDIGGFCWPHACATTTTSFLDAFSDICHNLVAKYSVIRARTVSTKPELLDKEIQHLGKVWTKLQMP